MRSPPAWYTAPVPGPPRPAEPEEETWEPADSGMTAGDPDPLGLDSGGSEGAIISARNISERKVTEQRIRYLARIDALRDRQARLDKLALGVSIALPGAAGVLSRRPLHSLLGALLFAIAVGALIWREGVVADPLVAGAAGPFAFLCVSVLAGISYAIVAGGFVQDIAFAVEAAILEGATLLRIGTAVFGPRD